MTWRYRFTLLIIIGGFFLVTARLFYWQVVKAEELTILAQSQYGRSVRLLPQRGEIRTSDNFPIATNKLSYLVYANPKQIKDRTYIADKLSPMLGVETATISALLEKNLFWVAIKSQVEHETKSKIEAMNLPGVGFEQQSMRFYSEASIAAHLIGFMGKNELGEGKGYFGLEGYYDRQLSGKVGVAKQIQDALGRPILAKVNQSAGEVDGRSLILHVDRVIQYIAENKLRKGVEKYGAAGGMVLVMDPKTGGIIAMAAVPSFDPRTYQEYEQKFYINPLISHAYEPGSTFKALVMAAALDKGVVKPDTRCDICSGPVEIGGYSIKTWNNKYIDGITMLETIQHSDNTGMVYISKKLGLDTMLAYFEKFGIGQTTGIDLQGEMAPTMRPKENWYPIDVATASFGQGITVTPIELLTGFSALANEGIRMEPHVVDKIETPEGEIISISPKELNRPVSSKTALIMKEILVNAVEKGESKFAKPKGYRIAGKTGTAQIPIEGHYDPNKTIASFIGFAPADDPKFAMLVIVDRPTTSIYGSETAAPLFFDIAKDIFVHYTISPTEPE